MTTSIEAEKRIVIVLSSGRSGTSLLMQALGALGMSLSENLIGPHHENPDGFFEDADIVNLHQQLLKDIGAKPFLPLPLGWQESGVVGSYKPKIRIIVERQIVNTATIWGFKDPRTCSLLPLWVSVLKSMWVVPNYVLAVREPGAAVRSLIKQAKISGEMAELVWLFRTCDALFNTAGDCCIVHYEDWFSRPSQNVSELLRHSGLDRYFHGDMATVLDGIVKPNLNRSVHDEYRITNPFVLQLYALLQECRGSNFDRVRLMQVVKSCRAAMENFRGWHMEAQRIAMSPDPERESETKKNAGLVADLRTMTLQNNTLLKQLKELHDKSEGLAIKIQALSKPVPEIILPAKVIPNGGNAKPASNKEPNKISKPTRRSKLWRKFKNDPRRFFSDSHSTLIRPLGLLFKSRN